ncbi:uncharacterized protein LOC132747603 [Ruditapes philippinarum]|uniref:uncharacterized protein LOC132747603 n=1 Tax=Ruditapes philippinarum TaxID=129788 RepID=UPI00295BCD0E|nr:uncharacterized protein LOC132747603 [Ruditapes philippinarum]
MADINAIRKSKEYKNYKSLDAALSILGQSLEHFTDHSVGTVHRKISQKLGKRPQCNKQCSRSILDHKRWCPTCFAWKEELTKYLKSQREQLKWNQMKSWMWPVSSDEIREVFMPADWKMKDINFKDLSTIINVWKRCTEVNARMVTGIGKLRKLRNEFTHKYGTTLYMEDNELLNKFFIIFNVLNHPDIQAAIPNFNDLIKTLKDLEQFGMETDVEKALCKIQSTLTRLLEEREKKNRTLEQNRTEKQTSKRDIIFWCFAGVMVPVLIAICFANLNISTTKQEMSRQVEILNGSTDCLSEDPIPSFAYKYVRMFGYLSYHHSFVGRQWLFKSLEEGLNQTGKGVVLITDMGFGKTAAVANIICATSSDASYNLKKHLLAYHICRFDSIITKQHFVFIRRLTSMIAKYIPMFNDILKNEFTSCMHIFDVETCENDPYGCFDECLIHPLRNIPDPEGGVKFVIIDALDECEHNHHDKKNKINGIASLLKYKLHLFPKWLKFIVTCRNISYCRQLKYNMKLIFLDSSDQRNIEDMKFYLSVHGGNKTEGKNEPFTFLLLTSTVQSNTYSKQFQSLNIYYEHQFKRYFTSGYKHAKAILEIICSALQPIDEDKLWYILSNTTEINQEDYDNAIGLLIDFVKFIDNKAYMLHISLREWLLDTDNIEFKINRNNGHYFNALYLIKVLQYKQEKIDIAELVLHAVHANKYMDTNVLDTVSSLISRRVIDLNIYKDDNPLHIIAKYTDSAAAMQYLLKYYPEADILDRQNVTPSFIAASMGNVDALKTLINAGANLAFRTKSFQDIINLDIAVQISLEKLHWDYGLLDIAVQNGHFKIVEFILKGKHSSQYPLDRRNGMNLLPVHLGCKLGHVKIVKYISNLYPWMLDNTCLYFAAERAHADLVDFIIKSNIKDDCKLCDSKLHWIPRGKIRIQSQIIVSMVANDYHNIYVLFDDWHFVACETALHVAVRLRYINVIKVLLNDPATTSHECFDRGGRTPLISAIQNNYSDIVELFIDQNLFRYDLRCLKSVDPSRLFQLNEKERQTLKLYNGPHNFTIMHIISKFDSLWIIDLLHKKNVKTQWNIYDSEGCLPIHVAACHGSLKMLEHHVNTSEKQLQNLRCKNGKTPVDSAAECGSFAATSFLLNQLLDTTGTLLSRLKKALISSALRKPLTSSLAIYDFSLDTNISKIVQLVVDSDEDIMIKFERNRNILHISLLNGHYQVVIDTFRNYPELSIQLMRDIDIDSFTPLHLAVSNLEKSTDFVFTFLLNLTMESSKSFLTGKEYSILLALEFVEKNGLIPSLHRKSILLDLVEKNHCSLISLYVSLVNKKILQDNEFIRNVLLKDYTSVLTYEIYVRLMLHKQLTASKIVKCANSCTDMISKCHLHILALKFGQLCSALMTVFDKWYLDEIEKTFKLYFQKGPTVYSSCYDSDGFNVLERAIQGWSAGLVKHLIEIGVKSKLSAKDLILIATNTKYRMKYEKYYILCKPYKDMSYHIKLIDKNCVREDIKHASKQGYDKVNVAKIINEEDSLRDQLIFLKVNYKLLDARDVCQYSGKRKLRKLLSSQKYNAFVKQRGNEMVTVLQHFLSDIQGLDEYSSEEHYFLTEIKYIQNNPEGSDGYPVFCEYDVSEHWGYLRKTFRFLVEYLKLRMGEEIGHIVRDTLFFSERFNLTMTATSLSIIPAFKYVKEIDNFPFFEDTYLLFLKAIRTGDNRWHFIEEASKMILYNQWNENAEKIRNYFFNDDMMILHSHN